MTQKVEISHRTVVFTVLFLLALWLLFQVGQIVLAFFISLTLVAALNPLVNQLERLRLPRFLAILIIYFLTFGTFSVAVGLMISPVAEETATLINTLPSYLDKLGFLGLADPAVLKQLTQFSSLPANLIKFAVSLFSNIVGIFTILVISYYLLMERKNLDSRLVTLFGETDSGRAKAFIEEVEFKLGGWVRGEALLMTIVGALYYVGLRLLGVEFALPLAIIGGILEVVPNIGPTISAVPAILVGLMISPLHAAAVAGLYFLVQQFENTLIVPTVMKKATGAHPLMTILALMIGWKLAGVLGAVLAVPVALVVLIIMSQFLAEKGIVNLK
ncbi:AI-2E family transporter [Candidatus Shapirobacteria bacterium]|nr:AI-2E family transporter [Candidatus Shapirobacteria bacterium]